MRDRAIGEPGFPRLVDDFQWNIEFAPDALGERGAVPRFAQGGGRDGCKTGDSPPGRDFLDPLERGEGATHRGDVQQVR